MAMPYNLYILMYNPGIYERTQKDQCTQWVYQTWLKLNIDSKLGNPSDRMVKNIGFPANFPLNQSIDWPRSHHHCIMLRFGACAAAAANEFPEAGTAGGTGRQISDFLRTRTRWVQNSDKGLDLNMLVLSGIKHDWIRTENWVPWKYGMIITDVTDPICSIPLESVRPNVF